MTSKCIEDLPDELLIEIFSYLSCEDLCHSVPFVNDRWKDVSNYSQLWQDMIFSPIFQMKDDEVIKVLKLAPNLQSFITKRGMKTEVIKVLCDYCKCIKSLEFHNDQCMPPLILSKILVTYPMLESLKIKVDYHKKRALGTINQLCQFTNLQSLRFARTTYLSFPGALIPLGTAFPKLQHLALGNLSYMDEDVQYILQKRKGHLLSFTYGCNEMSQCTVELLGQCSALKDLRLYLFYGTNELDIKPFKKLSNLKSLTLERFSDVEVEALVNIFCEGTLSDLVKLEISYCKSLTDKVAKIIIQNCKKLQRLSFERCYMLTDEGFEYISNCHKLTHINISGCKFSDLVLTFISECCKLKYLNISGCEYITDLGIKLMKDKYNELQVVEP